MRRATKYLAIPKAVKDRVWARDGGQCVLCGSIYAKPCAHIVGRAQGGLGIEENIVTLCQDCHRMYDQTTNRDAIRDTLIEYIREFYPEWDEKDVVYQKWKFGG